MPLFGKHNKDKDTARHGHHDTQYDAQRDTNLQGQEPYGTTVPNQANQGYDNMGHTTAGGSGAGSDPYNQPTHMQGGPGSGLSGAGPNPHVPPVSHINNDPAHSSGGGGGRFVGKAESAVGSLVGSQALKEKGFQKQQEAGAFKMQSAEIAEAERLEKEALMRRERAVAHGAHPDNRNLGGLQGANTLADVTGPGHTTGVSGGHGGAY